MLGRIGVVVGRGAVRSLLPLQTPWRTPSRWLSRLAAIEITPEDFAAKRRDIVVVDVRETEELELAKIPGEGVHHLALTRLYDLTDGVRDGVAEAVAGVLPVDREVMIVTVCHHGVRSKAAADLLRELGWTRVYSLHGGIHLYAETVDPSVGQY